MHNRPAGYTDAHKEFLNILRESGNVNMFGAASFLEEEFCIGSKDAKAYLLYWMENYHEN